MDPLDFIYIPSKGRPDAPTAKLLCEHGLPFKLMVEPQEHDDYAERWGAKRIAVLPDSGRGLAFSRNECKQHAIARGAKWHWQLDDDVTRFAAVMSTGRKMPCGPEQAFNALWDEIKIFENVSIAGMRSNAWPVTPRREYNQVVFTCALIRNDLRLHWRPDCLEDVDYTIQSLAAGFCTYVTNRYVFGAMPQCITEGGMAAERAASGQLRLIRGLQRKWPSLGLGVKMRNGMPRVAAGHLWRKFGNVVPRVK